MIDTQYIEELRASEDKKEAKAKLLEYADQFGFKIKKSKGFEAIVEEIKEGLEDLASEPMPEDQEGITISDLIQAADELDGKSVFKGEAKPEALELLSDSPDSQLEVIDVPKVTHMSETGELTELSLDQETFNSQMDKLAKITLEAPMGDIVKVYADGTVTQEENKGLTEDDLPALKEAVAKIVESEKEFELPKDFRITLSPMGKAPGYFILPWWIYQWISENDDWKTRPLSFSKPSAHPTLLSLLYIIKRDGQVLIRETRNSTFITLK